MIICSREVYKFIRILFNAGNMCYNSMIPCRRTRSRKSGSAARRGGGGMTILKIIFSVMVCVPLLYIFWILCLKMLDKVNHRG